VYVCVYVCVCMCVCVRVCVCRSISEARHEVLFHQHTVQACAMRTKEKKKVDSVDTTGMD